ncbi:MAG: hypothetical protein JNN15_16475, partial [Blastocatellia bacterium]|nr:hypothetical protein [Blastocatellia bacterium]
MRLLAIIIFILFPFASFVHSFNGDLSLIDRLLKESLSRDKVKADRAVEKLRSLGADAIDRIFTSYAAEFKKIDSLQDLSSATAFQKQLMELVERVSRQKYAYQSKLYWYTDLEKAKEEARKTRNPILSLRLLGNLDDELSCANSRFFRLTLYSNSEVSGYLKQHYIL